MNKNCTEIQNGGSQNAAHSQTWYRQYIWCLCHLCTRFAGLKYRNSWLISSTKWPFNLSLISSPFIAAAVKYLLWLRLSEVVHLLHQLQHTRRGLWHPCPGILAIKEKSPMKTHPRQDQRQTSEFKIDQKAPASTGAAIKLRLQFWSWLKFPVRVDISELWGIPSRQLTAGISVIQYLQGTWKWERCDRRRRTQRSQLFLTAFMEIEAQWGVQHEQQIYKKTRSEKRELPS